MENTNPTPATGITPQVGKRYVTRGGWITPAWDDSFKNWGGGNLEPIYEYVEPTVPDTFRRDLIARLYAAKSREMYRRFRLMGAERLETWLEATSAMTEPELAAWVIARLEEEL